MTRGVAAVFAVAAALVVAFVLLLQPDPQRPAPRPVPTTTGVVTSSTRLGIACPVDHYELRTGPVEADAIGCR